MLDPLKRFGKKTILLLHVQYNMGTEITDGHDYALSYNSLEHTPII